MKPQVYPVGTIRVRTRHKRGGEKRAFIKVAEPNTWVLLARHRWEQFNGPIPRGMGVHHKDENKLNDDISNLELTTKRQHLERHRDGHDRATAVSKWIAARRTQRWSTKSKTKITGRHPADCRCDLHRRQTWQKG